MVCLIVYDFLSRSVGIFFVSLFGVVGFADWVLLRCSGSASSWFLDTTVVSASKFHLVIRNPVKMSANFLWA
jgi:hypothetical protein